MSQRLNQIKKTQIGFGAVVAILLALMVMASVSFAQLVEANRWTDRTYRVLLEIDGIDDSVSDMEAGAHGFALTGDESFRSRLTTGQADYDRNFKAAQALVADERASNKLRDLTITKQQWTRNYIEPMLATQHDASNPAATVQEIRRISEQGKPELDAMRSILKDFKDRAADLLLQRSHRADRLRVWTEMTLIAGGLFAVVLTIVLSTQLSANLRRLTVTNTQLAAEIDERKEAESALQQAIKEADQAKAEAERAQAEAESASAAKSEFLSRMSHELRTPLNAILGFSQLMEMDDLDKGHRDGVRQILKGGRHLLELVNEVLDIASVDAGRMALSAEAVQLSRLVQETIALVQPLADERHIRFENDIGGGYVLADQQRLKQVLLNLLSNAVKYNREGGTVRLANGTAAVPRQVRFEVTDSGPGISPVGLEKLFLPFERLDAAEKGIEGTGIGLTISQRLVQIMDGEIGVYSVEGEGTTFWVELPGAQDPVQAFERGEAITPVWAAADGTEYSVLYVEDNLSNLNLIEHILARRGKINLLSAMQGRRGLELAREHRPDLILLDLHLPDMRGDEVLQHLRAETETKDIPVVMLSADATPRQVERLLQAGANAYLTKPLDVKRFLHILDETLQQGASTHDR